MKQESISVGCKPLFYTPGYPTTPGYLTTPPPRRNMDPEIPYYPERQKGHGTRDILPAPPEDRMTHACENITFPQLRWRAVINV